MSWESDAELAGTLYRKSKPYTAMLIARCVELSKSGVSVKNDTSKVSAGEFAELAGIATNTVKAYLRTWDAMAAAGLVPARDSMEPGEDVDVPDMKTWTYYYREANPSKPKSAKDDGVKVGQVRDEEVSDVEVFFPENRRVDQFARRLEMSRRSVESRAKGPAATSYNRAVQCLQEVLEGQNTGRNLLHLLDALTELGTTLVS